MRRVKWLWVFLIELLLTGVLFKGRRFYNKQAYPPPAPAFIPTHTQPQTNHPRRTAVPTRPTPAVSAPAKLSDLTKANDDLASEPCRITDLRVAALHGANAMSLARLLRQDSTAAATAGHARSTITVDAYGRRGAREAAGGGPSRADHLRTERIGRTSCISGRGSEQLRVV